MRAADLGSSGVTGRGASKLVLPLLVTVTTPAQNSLWGENQKVSETREDRACALESDTVAPYCVTLGQWLHLSEPVSSVVQER